MDVTDKGSQNDGQLRAQGSQKGELYATAQVSVIGALLIDAEHTAGGIFHELREEDFADSALRHLFGAARGLWLDKKSIDPVTVLNAAGEAYAQLIADCMRLTPTLANTEEYCRIVKDSARLRKIRAVAAQLIDCPTLERAQKLLGEAEGLLSDRPDEKAREYRELIFDYLDRQSDGSPPDYLSWGEEHIDGLLKLSPGRFVVLGADSSFGKTALALQFARHMAETKRVGFFSFETSHADAADRLLANAADVELKRSKDKTLSEADFRHVTAEGERSTRLNLTVIEAAGYTVDDIRAETLARRFEVIFVDYVQIVTTAQDERYRSVTEVSMGLHTMAQRLGVTVIALSQVTPPLPDKSGKRRRLRGEDLRESRQLLMDADAILMLDLDEPPRRTNKRVLIVDKNKDGPRGQMLLNFEPKYMRFTYEPPEGRSTAKRDTVPGQMKFVELPEDAGGELPF